MASRPSVAPRRGGRTVGRPTTQEGAAAAPDEGLAATALWPALAGPPAHRDADAVREALDWWLELLPTSGVELAPELQAPNDVLREVFRRGRLLTCARGALVQEEGDEVRHYMIIILGSCRIRVNRPAPSRGITPGGGENDEGAANEAEAPRRDGSDNDGFVICGELGRGEPVGLLPGEQRSPYSVQCTDKTTLLYLTAGDYEATLRPHHKELNKQAVAFLERHRLCPQATTYQLGKLVPYFRHRRIRRGRTIVSAGDLQRHVWFLREGGCTLLAPDSSAASLVADMDGEDNNESSEDETGDIDRLSQLRASSHGAEQQQQAAANELRGKQLAPYARGRLKRTIEGTRRSPRLRCGGVGPGSAASVKEVLCRLCEPGLMLGEEVLVYDNHRDMTTARCCYTVVADDDCLFYVADISSYRQLVMCIGPESISHVIGEKITRRCRQLGRGQVAARKLDKRKRQMQSSELEKQDRQSIRLPPSAGYRGVDELEDVNDWLRVVFEHRRAPLNQKSLPTLSVLEGTKLGPRCTNNGPGVSAMLKLITDNQADTSLARFRESLRRNQTWKVGRGVFSPNVNPMGDTIAPDAKYAEIAPPTRLCLPDASQGKLMRSESLPAPASGAQAPDYSGIFFQTELDLEESTALLSSTSVPSLPRLPGVGAKPSKEDSALGEADSWLTAPGAPSASCSADAVDASKAVPRGSESGKQRSAGSERKNHVIKAFRRILPGKSILVLTDKVDVKKSILRALLAADASLCFVKTSAELLHKIRDQKDQYHCLLIDLSKSELQVDNLLRSIRQHERYGRLPVVVLSADRELSDMVRSSCSFVVFQPLAVSMLREALLWCFDRRPLEGLFRHEDAPADKNFTLISKKVPKGRDDVAAASEVDCGR